LLVTVLVDPDPGPVAASLHNGKVDLPRVCFRPAKRHRMIPDCAWRQANLRPASCENDREGQSSNWPVFAVEIDHLKAGYRVELNSHPSTFRSCRPFNCRCSDFRMRQ
jgi:hypothetical protein